MKRLLWKIIGMRNDEDGDYIIKNKLHEKEGFQLDLARKEGCSFIDPKWDFRENGEAELENKRILFEQISVYINK